MINKTLLILLISLCFVANALADEVVSNKVIKTNEYVHIIGKDRQVKVEFLNHYIAKLTPLSASDTLIDTRYAVKLMPAKGILKFSELGDMYKVESDSILISIRKADISASVIDKISGDTLLTNIIGTKFTEKQGFSCEIDTTLPIYGVSSQASRYNKLYNVISQWNFNYYLYTYPKNKGTSLPASVPYFSFGNKFSLFVDNPSKALTYLGFNRTPDFYYTTDDLMPNMYIINRRGQADIIKEYYDLTGYQPLPPLWSFGYQQSKQFYDPYHVMTCVNIFRENEIPLESVIIDFFWYGYVEAMGDFTWAEGGVWNAKPQMDKLLEDNNIKTVLIAEPYMSKKSKNYKFAEENDYFVRVKGNEDKDSIFVTKLFDMQASLVDFTNPAALDWFVNLMKDVTVADKLAGWWLDLSEPDIHPLNSIHYNGKASNVHNLYASFWSKAVADSMISWRGGERPFLLTRAGWAGIQNNYVINWTGDCFRDYGAVYIQSPVTLSAGVCGLAYLHSDLGGFGGFAGRFAEDARLFVRWLQFSTFSPIMRAHSSDRVSPLPYEFGDEATAINRDFINLRYTLLPYIYTMAYENSTRGYPLCRAMNYYENTERFRETDDQYYFGRDILVAPIFDSTDSRKVLFPKGKWINYFTLDEYEGDSEAEVKADLSQMPLFIRAGAIIPNSTKIMNTAYYRTDTLLLNYYYDSTVKSSNGYVYIDDGISTNSIANKQYEILNYNAEARDYSIQFNISRNTNSWKDVPKDRVYIINIISKDSVEGDAQLIIGADTTTIMQVKHDKAYSTFVTPPIAGDAKIKISKYNQYKNSNQEYAANVFPNPVFDELNIILNDFEGGEYSLELYNSIGEKVIHLNEHSPANKDAITINFIEKYGYNPLTDGVYYGSIKVNNRNYKFQFIKKSR